MRVATWNLERADPRRPVGAVQARQIAEVAADIWLFTEARLRTVPGGFTTSTSEAMLTPEPALFAVIAAPRLKPIDLLEVPTGAAALVEGLGGRWLVVAVCMPWRLGAPTLPPHAAPGATTGPEQWRVVLDRLDSALTRLRTAHPDVPLILGGDLNQGLSGWLTGGTRHRDQLLDLIDRHGLTAHTAGSPSARPGAGAVDHLCATASCTATGWFMPAPVPGRAKPASDHAGYWADLDSPR
jgi:broad specificity phosphatase PhoE